MAKGKSRLASSGLDRDVFFTFMGRAATLKAKVDDANMAHAGQWTKADGLGIHSKVAKLYGTLDKMDPLTRADWLRAFDLYRSWSDWDAQQDIVDQAEAALAADMGEAEEREPGDGDQVDESDPEDRAPIVREPSDPEPEVEAEDADPEAVAAANSELAMAGHVFADGKQAAADGLGAEANPHPHDAPSHPIWARGHAQGLRDKEIAAAVPAEIVPVPKRSRAKRAEEAPEPVGVKEPILH